MENLTIEQFKYKFGDAKVVFSYYYKYSFSFKGEFEGNKIYINVGGDHNDIYRFDVKPNKEYLVKDLYINSASVEKDDVTIYEYIQSW